MEIRGEEVLIPVSAVSAFPRPHWLQGRVLGSLSEPVYRSQNLRVAYEDACKICAHEQEKAGLNILCDGAQYYEWEAPGFQLEPIFHFIPENLGGFAPYGPPGEGPKYRPFYQAVVKGKITWERPIFESVVMTMQNATDKPFKVAFLGPAQQSIIVKDEYYGDQVAVARDLAIAMNSELKYLVSMGLEAVQLIDVLPPYTTDISGRSSTRTSCSTAWTRSNSGTSAARQHRRPTGHCQQPRRRDDAAVRGVDRRT